MKNLVEVSIGFLLHAYYSWVVIYEISKYIYETNKFTLSNV